MYMANSEMAQAPRLMAWWQRVERASIQQMRREDWNTVIANRGIPVKFDVRSTLSRDWRTLLPWPRLLQNGGDRI